MGNLLTLQEISEKRDRKSLNSGVIVASRSNSAKFSLQESNSQNGSRSTIGDDLQESLQRGREGLDDESKEEEMEAVKPVIPMAIKKKVSIKEVVPITTEKKEEMEPTIIAEKISLLESKELHGERPFCEYHLKQGLDDKTREESMKARTSEPAMPTLTEKTAETKPPVIPISMEKKTAETKPVIPISIEKKEEKKAIVIAQKVSALESKDLHGEIPFCEYNKKQGLDDKTREESMKARTSESASPTFTEKTAETKPVIPISMEKKTAETKPVIPISAEKKEEKKAIVIAQKVSALESKDLHGERPFCGYDVEQYLDDGTKEESMKARTSESAVPMTAVKMAETKPVIPISMEKKEYVKPAVPIISETKEEKKATIIAEKISLIELKDLDGERSFCEYDVEKISKESQIQGSAPIILKEVRV